MNRDGFVLEEIGLNLIRCLIFEADAKDNDKASAVRSKHSVTEQRRRSKINERYVEFKQLKFQALEVVGTCVWELCSMLWYIDKDQYIIPCFYVGLS